ncbi:MAG: DNA gyrase/topoisomerase IV subunit A, partial [Muribaculaceae bacterium]|nr:DNA gyrase/topoisomerase IV subunit A [Muribaculaceae bacterium]
ANPNGEAEVVKVTLKPKLRLKNLTFDVDFGKLAIKGRAAQGNLVTKNEVHRFSLKERGASTLGGRKVWFDRDVLRLNYDGRGEYLGEFSGNDRILVVLKNGEYHTTGFEVTNHYDEGILRLEKFRPKTVWTAILNDADQGYPYIKRFLFDDTPRRQRFIGDNPASTLILLSDHSAPMFNLVFGGNDDSRPDQIVDAEEYIGVKSFKAKGKRLTTFELASVTELEPKRPDDNDEETVDSEPQPVSDVQEPAEPSDQEILDQILGQERLFTEDDYENQ